MLIETVLIVDDEELVVQSLQRTLSLEGYQTIGTINTEAAIRILQETPPAVLICDQRMPQMTGLELLSRARDLSPHTVRMLISGYSDIDVVISAINNGQIFQYISKPWSDEELLGKLKAAVQFRRTALEKEKIISQSLREVENWKSLFQKSNTQIKENMEHTVNALKKIIQVKDEGLLQHSLRVSEHAVQVARQMKLSVQRQQNLEYAGLFHDIGKIAIQDQILYKAGKLDESEYTYLQAHPGFGAEILRELGFLDEVAEITLQHHEKFDGSGYPRKMRGDEILIEARILAFADAYDALTSTCVYQESLNHKKTLSILRQADGTHFDPEVVEQFLRLQEEQ